MSTTMDQIHHIREMYYQQDKSITQIASETGLNRKTVSKYKEDFRFWMNSDMFRMTGYIRTSVRFFCRRYMSKNL